MTGAPRFRPATADDSHACFLLFRESIIDLAARNGVTWDEPADEMWGRLADLYRLLGDIAAEWWVAEDDKGNELIGYARSIERGADHGMFELAEFFVRPGRQSSGVGRELLQRAFPVGRGDLRVIIATSDLRAVSRYHRADTSIQFPILGLTGVPSADALGEVTLEPLRIEDAAALEAVAALERELLERDRGEHELRWLLERREGYLYTAAGRPVASAFIGVDGAGPIASRDPAHLPQILRHVESRAAAIGRTELGFDVPAPNVVAIRHLLERGYRLDPFVTFLMANRPFGRFDRYVGFTPPFVL